MSILYDFAWMSLLMVFSKIIRSRVRIIQQLYIPSSLIAGVFGLFLGKQFLNFIPFSSQISSYPGVLIAFVFGSMFIGNSRKVSFKKMIASVGDTFLVNTSSEVAQFGFFTLIGVTALPLIFKGINPAFGLMLPSGFVGGHGTAAAIGSVLVANGWEEATSIGQTFATIGLLGGILGGVLMINIAARRGQTAVIDSVSNLNEEMLTGLVRTGDRSEFGSNTINAMSLDTLTWHLALILTAVGMAYGANYELKKLMPSVSFPIYGLSLICSIILQGFLKIVKLDEYVDRRIITHVGSTSTDFLVAFGMASINISVVIKYLLPILLLCFLGFFMVLFYLWIISPRFFRNYWFERGIYIFGLSTGVMATGVLLLRITDPEFKTGVLEDFGFAWIFLSFIDLFLVSFSPIAVLNGFGVIYSIILLVIAGFCLFLSKKVIK